MSFRDKYRSIRLWLGCGTFIAFFSIAIIISIFFGWNTNKKEKKATIENKLERKEAFAKGVNYYTYKDNKASIHLNASELMMDELEKNTIFYEPEGVAYSKDMSPINYRAQSGNYNEAKQILHFKDEVTVQTKDAKMMAGDIIYEMSKDLMTCKGKVETSTYAEQTGDTIIVTANKVISHPRKGISTYYRNVKGKVSRKRKYETPLFFDSNKMILDLKQSKVELLGEVRIVKKTMNAQSHKGEIFLKNYNKRLKYFVLYDDVQVKEELKIEGMPIVHRRAYAEKLEGIMSEDIYVLTGFPKVFQDNDMIRGNRIILRDNNEVIEIDDISTKLTLE